MERDCNTCRHHDQARAAGTSRPRCVYCIQFKPLPMWEPMKTMYPKLMSDGSIGTVTLDTPLPTIEYPLNGGLKVPGESLYRANILDRQVVNREDFSKCSPLAHVIEEGPKGSKMVGPFSFPIDGYSHSSASKVNLAMPGIGGAPTRATTLPEVAAERKKFPVASGVLDYFPDAIVAVSYLSFKGNEQHNPGQPLNWCRGKSNDHADTMLRHFLQRGTRDTDGVRHSVKMVWRALALLQEEIEAEHAD